MANIGDIVYRKDESGYVILGLMTTEKEFTYMHFAPNWDGTLGLHLMGMTIGVCNTDDKIIVPPPTLEFDVK